LTIWPTCRGPWRPAASDLAVAPSSTPGSPKSKACPARPRRTLPRHMLGPVPLRAFYCVPSGVGIRADHAVLRPATNHAAILLIETDSKSLIGPRSTNPRTVRRETDRILCSMPLFSHNDLPMRPDLALGRVAERSSLTRRVIAFGYNRLTWRPSGSRNYNALTNHAF
jgi:hypothetical protein